MMPKADGHLECRRQHFSSGHFECKKRTHLTAVGSRGTAALTRRAFCASGAARAAPVEHSAVPGQARAAPVEHSASPGQTREAPVEYSAAPGRARAAISSHLRPRGGLERPFRAICGSGPSSSGHIFEPSAAPGRARAAISSQLRLRGGLERPFRAICGSGPSSSGHMQQIAAFLGRCGVFEPRPGPAKHRKGPIWRNPTEI